MDCLLKMGGGVKLRGGIMSIFAATVKKDRNCFIRRKLITGTLYNRTSKTSAENNVFEFAKCTQNFLNTKCDANKAYLTEHSVYIREKQTEIIYPNTQKNSPIITFWFILCINYSSYWKIFVYHSRILAVLTLSGQSDTAKIH